MTVEIERAAQAFSAMGSEPRLQVLLCLVRAGEAGLLVGDIQSRTGIPASTLNHHLKFMAAAGLIDQEKQGRTIVNRANFDFLGHVGSFIIDQCCADACLTEPNSSASSKEKSNV
jgi:DNA-binding transcriptional ArsR family regulator